MTQSERMEFKVQIKKLLANGWVMDSHSCYAAQIILVKKPDITLQMYVDVTNLVRQAPRRHRGRRADPRHTMADPCLCRHGNCHPTCLAAVLQPLPILSR